MGLVLAHCGDNGDPPECETNEDCLEGFWCNRTTGTCDCIIDCTGKCCGDDGCGGTCPDQCQTGFTCNSATCMCEAPDCTTDQDCINKYGTNYTCNLATNECQCNPDCTGKCCGGDGCGGTCQDTCTAPATCNTTTCLCEPPCTGAGDCQATECCLGNPGVCTPMNCTGLQCGNDPVCGKSCGTCTAPATCQNGQCIGGDHGLGTPCTFGDVNAAAGDCDTGLECLGIAADGAVGTCPGGAPSECVDLREDWNRDCVNSNCGASFCSQECDTNGNCPDGFIPQDVGNPAVCMCIPGGGDGEPGDPCPWNDVNASYPECQAGMACLGNEDTGSCPGGQDSECTSVAPSWNNDCQPNNVCGFSFCSPECEAGRVCPAGFYDADVGTPPVCYCIPNEDGTSQPGDPCPWGDVNTSYDFCANGLSCLGSDDAGSCPGGSPTECTDISEVENADCVNGTCGFSFCSEPCDANGNCPSGFAPGDVGGSCYCIPVVTGNAQAGEPCPFGDVNAAADYCAVDLACLGMAADGTSGTCPGGTDTECTQNDPPIPANQNPDCVNNNCGASFCAEKCDANGNCDAGFTPIDVGDPAVCYCVPS